MLLPFNEKGATGAQGPAGAHGLAGAQGPPGTTGSASGARADQAHWTNTTGRQIRIPDVHRGALTFSTRLPAGSYWVRGTAFMSDYGGDPIDCGLFSDSDVFGGGNAESPGTPTGEYIGEYAAVVAVGLVTLPTAQTVTISCEQQSADDIDIYYVDLSAIEVGATEHVTLGESLSTPPRFPTALNRLTGHLHPLFPHTYHKG